jgi:hypothetical protein
MEKRSESSNTYTRMHGEASMKPEEITLVIDGFTPQTLPMHRLAAYMREFAILLGSEERVNFRRIRKGSACIVASPHEQALPKVNQRLEEVVENTAPREAVRARREIDELLAADNAIGHIERNGAKVIVFPGRLRPHQEKIGPVRRSTSIEGTIYQIGGKDETINVHMRGRDGDLRAEVSIDLARKLAPHLLLGKVRLFGEGDWYRVNGKWERHKFTAFDFAPLDTHSLEVALRDLSQLFVGIDPDDLIDTVTELRGA